MLYWDIVGCDAVSGSKLLFLEVVVRRVKGKKSLIRWIALRQLRKSIESLAFSRQGQKQKEAFSPAGAGDQLCDGESTDCWLSILLLEG